MLGFFGMNPTVEKGELRLNKGLTEMTVSIQKAGIPKVLQTGFPPIECVMIQAGQPHDFVN